MAGALLTVVALVGSAMALGPIARARADDLPSGPLYQGDFPDPFVLEAGAGMYFAYATNGSGNVPVIRSSDLRNWSGPTDAMPRLPSWAKSGSTWAPAVVQRNGTFVLYVTMKDATSGLQCIGRAVSAVPAGPFVDSSDRPFICQTDRSGSIDPSPFVAADGSLHLVYKSEGISPGEPTRLWSQRLTDDGLSLAGPAVELLHTDQAWEGPIVEGPDMVLAGGSYFLVYAGNEWSTSAYAIGYARCEGPEGPCVKYPMNPLLGSGPGRAGPGAPGVVLDLSRAMQLTFHAWTPPAVGYPGGARTLRATHLFVHDDHLALDATPLPGSGGYRLVASDGGVFAFGTSPYRGSMGGSDLQRPVVGAAATPTGQGYWEVASDGGVFAFGDAGYHGSTGATHLNKPIVAMAATPTGRGYWLVASDGGIFSFGDARFLGSTGNVHLNRPIVGMATTATGRGYWLVASDGGLFAFGDARFMGSMGGTPLRAGIVGMAARPWGDGYWLVAADGGVFTFGAGGFFGSTGGRPLVQPIVSIQTMPGGDGYRLVAADGGVFAFGSASFQGSTGAMHLASPIVAGLS